MLPHPSAKTLFYSFQGFLKDKKRISALLQRYGLHTHHSLISMLEECQRLYIAQNSLDEGFPPRKREDSLSCLIQRYVKCGKLGHALTLYDMGSPCLLDGGAFLSLLKACSQLKDAERGRRIYAEVARNGLLNLDPFIGSALVDMHAKCGLLVESQEVFDSLRFKDVVTWTALIGGYADHGYGAEALKCFQRMQLAQVFPNEVTYACSLKACSAIGAAEKGQEIHDIIERKGFLKTCGLVSNTLIDMYGKCGMLGKAKEVFNKLERRDVVSWTALIGGYIEHGHCEEALKCFEMMLSKGIFPSALTFSCILKACGILGALDKGKEVHLKLTSEGLLKRNLFVGNALVDMYAKCGMLAQAQEVFDELPIHDLVSWNALVTGYALLVEVENVASAFERMRREGIKPDMVTFVSILNVCSHSGLIEMGVMYYNLICIDYGITPTLEHYTCMIDLFSRAGQLEEAVAMMKSTQYHPNMVLWLTILGACCKWGHVELGRHAFEEVLRLDEKEDSAYVCMYNIYAYADMPDEAKEVDTMREKNETRIRSCMHI